ncbi:Helix-turn-helix [Cohnella sp. OV330]|uniref:helix-turn-helix transcriptional regulator n=1 Tax=Cohnella sp. OV330 TaxID=1855288 RepID=UPI0008E6BA20|nr:helix-turn-helix domain-containing protein [Cohnella sp. OV330]SFB62727.1 Helix-turn-helix [Cohnella sp. OV330]
MSIGDAIRADRVGRQLTQQAYAQHVQIDRTTLSKIENGERELPAVYEASMARHSWKLALEIADERTNGYFSNLLGDVPTLDLHPAALKEQMLKEVDDLEEALGGLSLAKHIDKQKRKESAERVWHEIRDVMEHAAVLQGVLEEEFGLDRDELATEHEQQVKRGER